jgi:putative oxidoreductase
VKKLFERLEAWSKNHHPKWIDALRIALGLIIHLRTIIFIGAGAHVIKMMEAESSSAGVKFMLYSIGLIQFLGGTFIVLGLWTRIMVLIQIPALIASVIFSIVYSTGFFLSSDLLLGLLILFLLIFFFIEGSGRFSVDQYLRNSYKTYQPDARQ